MRFRSHVLQFVRRGVAIRKAVRGGESETRNQKLEIGKEKRKAKMAT
jgi:hypothetical protein